MTITKLKLNEEVQEANGAKRLLADPLLKGALESLSEQYLDALLKCVVSDDIGRFRFGEGIKVVKMLTRQLEIVVQNGKLPQAELDAMKGTSDRFF